MMAKERCPSGPELEKLYWKLDRKIESHLVECASCARNWEEIERFSALGRAVPIAELDRERHNTLRERLLDASLGPHTRSRHRTLVVAAASILVVGTALAGAIRFGAVFDEAKEGEASDVAPARHVENASPSKVETNVVDRSTDPEPFAGETNISRRPAYDDKNASRSSIEAGGASRSVRKTKVVNRSIREASLADRTALDTNVTENVERETERDEARARPREYEMAWEALRREDHDSAASLFASVIEKSDDDPLKDDARYWRSVALARAGRRTDARRAFDEFLERSPNSMRAGEASAIAGWLAYDDGDWARAETLFERAIEDPSSRVSSSAEAGLRLLRSVPIR